MRGIVKGMVDPLHLLGEGRANLIHLAADRDDGVGRLMKEMIQALAVLPGNIDANFFHHLDRHRVYIPRRPGAGASGVKIVAGDRGKMPSPMWLRHEFPVQKMRTVGFMIVSGGCFSGGEGAAFKRPSTTAAVTSGAAEAVVSS